MGITFQNKSRSIRWGLQDRFEDLDFAVDICLLLSPFKDTKSKINELVAVASEFYLKIDVNKNKKRGSTHESRRRK